VKESEKFEPVRLETSIVVSGKALPLSISVSDGRFCGPQSLPELSESTAREVWVRVMSALQSCGVRIERPFTVRIGDVSPEWLAGEQLDVPLGVALAAWVGKIGRSRLGRFAFGATLGLDGGLRPIRGVYPLVRQSMLDRVVVVPPASMNEAHRAGGARVTQRETLSEILLLVDEGVPQGWALGSFEGWRRACREVDAGARSLLLVGPPGAGKTAIARELRNRLPLLADDEREEVATVHSSAGLFPDVLQRPFRAPHHSVSEAGLFGGGKMCRPGEISLAHRGVLLLDEVTEFRVSMLSLLREVTKRRQVIGRLPGGVPWTQPADPCLVVATATPCPCGSLTPLGPMECRCEPEQIRRHTARISPLLEDFRRIDVPAWGVPR